MDKKLIRANFRKKNYNFSYDYKIFKDIKKILKINKKLKNILLYIPLKKEVNLLKFKRKLSKYQLFSPIMLEDGKLKIVKLRYPLVQKKFKVKESISKRAINKIDLAIIPSLGVDCNLRRIGFGKGYYDKTFTNYNNLLIIFIQNKQSLVDFKICSKQDLQADIYITSNKFYVRKESNNECRRNYIASYCSNFRINHRLLHCKKNKRCTF
ncbi:5-formyltetrahydrofolate cyclo-ligase [Campylobacter canadensis]|uniref:5-formyltetrahydrofolate cyclo-ligase n=1 Tax=Campylobacter canadensis TaxID=449520 RepID=A0ABS7WQD2_9BACT|nr:5-formyltetrahydrofolate cyclo-ligase [Campylobacter canadensis]MBZ7986547.1 5-formyltetrahydrofolate cyclo-ligase [Campylobacter canadensis]MBZ7994048.1 5-formyltetrahydrofolate cyclo-ligase [Campylobacter canadensis]MBZ7995949.1 5-formyltetrahydrofolate cyclo-ligase [Campylobacter canadensis]MBZ7997583.1 5-formyltetrahydrofolate cyclo-ligase [Campylobacter canadensis]MBZ7999379.1 5-formyltetrahydrofolate cyclo-ligase [Campylobacter canadensis]